LFQHQESLRNNKYKKPLYPGFWPDWEKLKTPKKTHTKEKSLPRLNLQEGSILEEFMEECVRKATDSSNFKSFQG
jgi:hypothetical protein